MFGGSRWQIWREESGMTLGILDLAARGMRAPSPGVGIMAELGPPKIYILKFQPLVLQNVTMFRDNAFKEVTKFQPLRWDSNLIMSF